MTTYDHIKRIKALQEPDEGVVCYCPTCGVATMLLRSRLRQDGFDEEDVRRIRIEANDFRGASHPYLASVRIDGQEVYRIMDRPDEVFEADVFEDIVALLMRGRRS